MVRGVWVGCIREGLGSVGWGVWGVGRLLCVGCMGKGGKAWGLGEGVELYGGVVVGGWVGEAGVGEGGAKALGDGVVGVGVEPRRGAVVGWVGGVAGVGGLGGREWGWGGLRDLLECNLDI